MTPEKALEILTKMSDQEFNQFFEKLPERVKLLVRSGLVNWKEALPEWYIKLSI